MTALAWSGEGGSAVVPIGRSGLLDRLFRSHYVSCVRLAGLLTGERDLGEEIAQDAFARLYEVADRVYDPAAYLRATVVNLSRSRVRRFAVRRRHPDPPPPAAPGPEASVVARLDVRSALAALPARQREAVVLRYYGDLTDAQVAEAMGISAGAVKSHLHRAVAALAPRLEALR